jgi:AbiU2
MVIEGDEPGQTIVYEISDGGFVDGIEIRQIVEILRVQNEDGANDALSKTDAAAAAMMVRNGLLARLVLLVSRVYSPPRKDDMHVARAFELLKDTAVKAEIATRGPGGSLDKALETWEKLKGDPRLPKVKHFRDKYTAHLGKPNPKIPLPEFQEVFGFARETTSLLDQLARATGARTEGLDTWDYQAQMSAEAFWAPWSQKGGGPAEGEGKVTCEPMP